MVTSYTVSLFGHLLGVVLFFSGVMLAAVPFEAARRREGAAEIAALLELARIGALVAVAGAIVVLGFGLWLVDASGRDFDAGWLSASLGLYVVAVVLGALGGRRPKQARLRAAELRREGGVADAGLRRLLDDPVSRALNYLSGVLLVTILVLMVFKP